MLLLTCWSGQGLPCSCLARGLSLVPWPGAPGWPGLRAGCQEAAGGRGGEGLARAPALEHPGERQCVCLLQGLSLLSPGKDGTRVRWAGAVFQMVSPWLVPRHHCQRLSPPPVLHISPLQGSACYQAPAPQTKGDSLSRTPRSQLWHLLSNTGSGSHPEVWEPAWPTSPCESRLAFEVRCQGQEPQGGVCPGAVLWVTAPPPRLGHLGSKPDLVSAGRLE